MKATRSLRETHPKIADQWHPTKNGVLKPEDVTAGSGYKVWWACSVENDHEWCTNVFKRTSGRNCPYCSNKKVVLSNCLLTTHPDIANRWHTTKNGRLTSADVVAGSNRKVWWQCPVAEDHEWRATVYNYVREPGCPCCLNKTAVPSNCFLSTHPHRAAFWDFDKNAMLPSDVTSGSVRLAWWKCGTCGHSWKNTIRSVARKSVNGCTRCGNATKGSTQKLTLGNFITNARKKHGDRYDYSESNYWNSTTRLTIICTLHGSFQQLPFVHISHGSGCPKCGRDAAHAKLHGDMPEAPTVLYLATLVDVDGTKLGKWGWTTRTFATRFCHKQYRSLNVHPLILLPMRLDEAQFLEKELRRRFACHRVMPIADFDGFSECFDLLALPKIQDYLQANVKSESLDRHKHLGYS